MFILYTNEAKLWVPTGNALLIATSKKKNTENTGSSIRFCNLATSIEITHMLVAIEPRTFGKHKIYHIILQEMRKESFGNGSSDS